MIYQELSLAPDLSVMENIVLGVEPRTRGVVRWSEMRETARRALARSATHDMRPDAPRRNPLGRRPADGGDRARARDRRRVLVLDEPTSSLGREDYAAALRGHRAAQADGHAIVYISHFIEEVKEVADRIVVLRDGRVAGSLDRTAPASEIVCVDGRRRRRGPLPAIAAPSGEAVLADRALRGHGRVSFTLHRGEILGIAGLLGAGRTRLLRSIFGLETGQDGPRQRGDAGPAADRRATSWSHGMGMVSEDRKGEGLATGLSIADNLTLSASRAWDPAPS